MLSTIALLALTVLVAACTPPSPDDELRDLGSYKLGHNIVVAPKVQMVPGSRPVEAQEWIDLLTNEVSARFSQYEGDQLYHFGISVEGYFVAPGGVPLVLSPTMTEKPRKEEESTVASKKDTQSRDEILPICLRVFIPFITRMENRNVTELSLFIEQLLGKANVHQHSAT